MLSIAGQPAGPLGWNFLWALIGGQGCYRLKKFSLLEVIGKIPIDFSITFGYLWMRNIKKRLLASYSNFPNIISLQPDNENHWISNFVLSENQNFRGVTGFF